MNRRDRGERRWQQKHDAAERSHLKALLTLWSQHGAPSDRELAETTGTLDESRVAHCLDGGWAGESEIAALVAGIVKYPLTQRPTVSAKTVLKRHRALIKVRIYTSNGHLGTDELFAEIAAYLGSAGLGGFIGDRTDAIILWTGRTIRRQDRAGDQLLQDALRRWHRRGCSHNDPLSKDEATDVATAALIMRGPANIVVISSHRRTNRWTIKASAQRRRGNDIVRVTIPDRAPSRATITIRSELRGTPDPGPEV
jgi:hypothetical protein